jgi:hypothetical protein
LGPTWAAWATQVVGAIIISSGTWAAWLIAGAAWKILVESPGANTANTTTAIATFTAAFTIISSKVAIGGIFGCHCCQQATVKHRQWEKLRLLHDELLLCVLRFVSPHFDNIGGCHFDNIGGCSRVAGCPNRYDFGQPCTSGDTFANQQCLKCPDSAVDVVFVVDYGASMNTKLDEAKKFISGTIQRMDFGADGDGDGDSDSEAIGRVSVVTFDDDNDAIIYMNFSSADSASRPALVDLIANRLPNDSSGNSVGVANTRANSLLLLRCLFSFFSFV